MNKHLGPLAETFIENGLCLGFGSWHVVIGHCRWDRDVLLECGATACMEFSTSTVKRQDTQKYKEDRNIMLVDLVEYLASAPVSWASQLSQLSLQVTSPHCWKSSLLLLHWGGNQAASQVSRLWSHHEHAFSSGLEACHDGALHHGWN